MGKKNKSFGEAVAVGSALAGAALGAAAVFLSDRKNQEKIKKTVDEASSEAVKIGKQVKKKVEEIATSSQKKKTVEKRASVTKKTPEKEEAKPVTPEKKD